MAAETAVRTGDPSRGQWEPRAAKPPTGSSQCEALTRTVMGDTKKGRERKGLVKREQRRERDIEKAIEHQDEDVDFEELYEGEELEL